MKNEHIYDTYLRKQEKKDVLWKVSKQFSIIFSGFKDVFRIIQTSKMKLFAEIVNRKTILTTLEKSSILDA